MGRVFAAGGLLGHHISNSLMLVEKVVWCECARLECLAGDVQ